MYHIFQCPFCSKFPEAHGYPNSLVCCEIHHQDRPSIPHNYYISWNQDDSLLCFAASWYDPEQSNIYWEMNWSNYTEESRLTLMSSDDNDPSLAEGGSNFYAFYQEHPAPTIAQIANPILLFNKIKTLLIFQ